MHDTKTMRAAQAACDLIQDRSGCTSYRQALLLHAVTAALAASTCVGTGLTGTMPMHLIPTTICGVGFAILIRLIGRTPAGTDPETLVDMPGMVTPLMTIIIAHMTLTASAILFLITGHLRGDGSVPYEVSVGLGLLSLAMSRAMRKKERKFREDCAEGRITAPRKPSGNELRCCAIITLALCANALVHGPDLTSTLGAGMGLAHAAATLASNCVPRPPRARRKRSGMSIGRLAPTAT